MDRQPETTVSAECHAMEQTLSAMLARVQRRCALPPVNEEDGAMNKAMEAGLRDAVRLTHAFMDATTSNYSPLHRARKLVALADGMPRFIGMLRGLEGDKKLSPLFERMLDREYYELQKVVRQMRDTVRADSVTLLAALPEKPRPDAFSFMATCMMMPFALACSVVSGVAQGISEARRERAVTAEPDETPKPPSPLRLVHSR